MSVALLAASLAASAISQYAASRKNQQARDEEAAAYKRNQLALDAEKYRSPLDSISNRALLKTMDERLRDQKEAEDNRAAAGGATYENRLAAKENSNRMLSGMYSQLLSGEDARRLQLNRMQMGLDNQHSQNVANNYLADARNWQAWGAATSQALMQYGLADMMGGSSLLDSETSLGPALEKGTAPEGAKAVVSSQQPEGITVRGKFYPK